MNHHPQHYCDTLSLIHDSMNNITMLLFSLLISCLGVECRGVNQSVPVSNINVDSDLLSNLDKLARKMDPQTRESMTHTLKLD